VVPAIREVLVRAQAAIDSIAAAELSSLSFENTFWALENATEEL
jgi:Zn-dependent oligopeptidase